MLVKGNTPMGCISPAEQHDFYTDGMYTFSGGIRYAIKSHQQD
jgi:hypothetical protein